MYNKSRTEQMVEYYHEVLKYRLYAIAAFAIGAASMMISKEATILAFLSLFMVPSLLRKR